ncbi:hypothetical protein EAS64_13295 [Trebonia kvetii]|uniref:Leucine-rich repeat domain-containing protein n=1 Tax=Trebonia kvetii TaxID=2480626 RepID=A0A6P2C4S8_9ACTN|nr:hypothetical protein [Trebonia kvetii]TVZ05505.1 hypothetical protein EAS64_13295 [Trebonia kvetii]
MTVLRFPPGIAVGEVFWDPADPGEWGHLLAIGAVEVPDGTAVSLTVYPVAEVSVFSGDQPVGPFEVEATPAGSGPQPAVPLSQRLLRRARPARHEWRVTWHHEMPDRALRNTRSIWGDAGYSVAAGNDPVDLEFIRGLPVDSVYSLSVGNTVPASFATVAHLAPGLLRLDLYIDNLDEAVPSVIAKLRALESLALYGDSAIEDGPGLLNDHALSLIADLPNLEYLSLMDGSYTEHGLRQLIRLPKLRHLHIERAGLTAPMFRFAADMPALTNLTGLDEFGDDGPMPPAEVAQVQAMLPHISMDAPG